MKKKKFLNIFFAPLLAVPIVLSSCSNSDIIYKAAEYLESFVVNSDNYSLVITPYCDYKVNYNASSLLADVSVVLNHPETISKGQKIHIDNISIADSYKNPHNGYTYKTNIVTFGNYNAAVYDQNSEQYFDVEYDIDNFSVSANIFNPYLVLAYYNLSDAYEFNIYDSIEDFKYTDGYTTPTCYNLSYYNPATIHIKNSNFDVQTFSTLVSDGENNFVWFDTIDFTNKLTTFDYFKNYYNNQVDIDLPPSLKTISKKAFDYVLLKYVFKIPQSVETIGDDAFSNLHQQGYKEVYDSSSNDTKGWIMVPNKFKKDETRIFGDGSSTQQEFYIEYY